MVALWICLCAFLSCAGWLLSLLHQLNRTGYLVLFAAAVTVVVVWNKKTNALVFPELRWAILKRRFRRGFPLAFLILAGLAILGGILHAPSNYDGLTYRTPRVLHWLAAEQWHWVQTDFPRLNVRPTGYEWVTAPMLALLRTDRWLFLISAVSFLLLPGLVFSLLHRLGVRRRVAWYWMWLLPTGYTYLLQAGSIGNDLFGSVFGIAAIDFALRARTGQKISDVWLSLLAAALLTGTKSSNAPLGLPWLIAVWPAIHLVRHYWASTFAIGLVAVAVSLVPISLINIHYCGDWSGQKLEHAAFGGVPGLRLVANTIGFTIQNFVPPVFPVASQWNSWVKSILPPELTVKLQANFEPSAALFQLGEMQSEESAGLGFGVCVCLSVTVILALRLRVLGKSRLTKRPRYQAIVSGAGWLAASVFLTQSGLAGAVRYFGSYYVFLAAPFLAVGGIEFVVRQSWWRRCAYLVFFLGGLLLVVNPGRPLWPAVPILRSVDAEHSSSHLMQRAWKVYSVYSGRADAFASVRAVLPKETAILGVVSFDDPETSLWRPFGVRRVLHVRAAETGVDLRARHIEYVLASSNGLAIQWNKSINEWLRQVDGELVQTLPLLLRAGPGPSDWYLVRIRPAP